MKNFRLLLTFVLILMLSGVNVNAQINYVHYTASDGMVQTQAESVFQDSKGYLWIGTKSGLSRFNGYEFHNFGSCESLIGVRVLSFLEDAENVVWARSNRYIFRLEGEKIKSIPVTNDSAEIHQLVSTNAGLYYVLRQNKANAFAGLGKISDEKADLMAVPNVFYGHEQLKVFKYSGDLYVRVIGPEKTALYRLSEKDRFILIGKNEFIGRAEEGVKSVRSLLFDDGTKIIDTHTGPWMIKDTKGKFYFLEDADGKGFDLPEYEKLLWADEDQSLIFTANDSIYRRSQDAQIEFLTCLPGATGALYDTAGNTWLASERGLFRLTVFENFGPQMNLPPGVWSIAEYPKDSIRFFHWGSSAKAENNMHIYTYKNHKIASVSPELISRNEGVGKNTPYSNSFYMGSRVLSDNKLYITSRTGCYVYDGQEYKRPRNLPQDELLYIYEDTLAEKVFFAFQRGLYQIDFSQKQIKIEKILPFRFFTGMRIALCLERGQDGNIYIGTGNGLARYDYKDIHFMHKDTMPYAGVRSLYRDYKGNLWLGSENGLWHYDYKTFTRFEHPELSRQVSALCETDDSHLLAGARRGVALVDIEKFCEDGTKQISFYDETAGYLGGEVTQNAMYKDSRGNVWIAGKEQTARFNYKDLVENQTAPRVYIDKVLYRQRDGEEQPLRKMRPVLRSQYNNVRFYFSGLSYGAPGQVYFKYQLENYDKNVSQISEQRFAAYKNLPPGHYRFKVWAANESNKWSELPATISFRIKPDLCQMLWFKIVSLLLSAAFIAWLTLFFYRRYKKNQQNREKLAELQMLTITGQLYPHFLFNAVTNISNAIYHQKSEEAYNYTTKLIHLVRIVHEARRRPTLQIQEEIIFIKTYLDIQKYRFKKRFDYSISVQEGLDLQVHIPQMLIQSFVENAVKHGLEPQRSGGNLDVEIKQKNDFILAIVTDNGIGLKTSRRNKTIGSGKGTGIVDTMLNFFNRRYKTNIRYEIIDLYEQGETGTKVIIYIPA